jgi:hypothetical protein
MARSLLFRGVRAVVLAAVGVEVLYVLVINALLFSGVLARGLGTVDQHVDARFSWTRAWSPWPGRAYVRDFRLAVADPALQFELTIARASFDVAPLDLLRHRFTASHIRAEGVRFRLAPRVTLASSTLPRALAFPAVDGFSQPALLADPPLPPLTADELGALWTVQLEDTVASVDELWLLEYHYQGAAQLRGGLVFTPLQHLEVTNAALELEGGALGAGRFVLTPSLAATLLIDIEPVDLLDAPLVSLLHALQARLKVACEGADLRAAGLYSSDLQLTGAARVVAELHVSSGRVTPGSKLQLWVPALTAQRDEQRFDGAAQATMSVTHDGEQPSLHATLSGSVRVALPGAAPLTATVSALNVEALLSDNALFAPPALERLYAVLGELKITDTQPITEAATRYVPVIAPLVLGLGPLTASGSAYMGPDYTLLRLKHAKLGDAELEGAAIPGAHGWNGAAAGHFGAVMMGLRLRDNTLVAEAFTQPTWLELEYLKAGIRPE